MGIREYLEIIGGVIGILIFISPIICNLLKGRIMPSVHKAISENNKEIKKDFKYDLKNSEDNIISIARQMVKEEVDTNEAQQERERALRSINYSASLDSLKSLVIKNEALMNENNKAIVNVLESIKSEINSLSKTMINHEGRIIENKDKLKDLEKRL